ncbi:type 2 lanthipeptide synthetase LanM family protein [Salibacterium halotolerans]|uniref:Type 2 lantibiotic biosynthesis protein LanM n=1 Tax=Salibacterium halotolerans TaxID=1884432 RepID=A0A1I5WSK4_9BACI|nr:type 2 lanthipeptide synthetase LanM family protein [Salibacterium halotolerans]SFQ22743.1 type 2 lantibiotic biosynthesis protein LanM [Salibacterium halotolerans]
MEVMNETNDPNVLQRSVSSQEEKEELFAPFYAHIMSWFEKSLDDELNKVSDTMVQKEAVSLSLAENYKRKIMEITRKVLIFEFHQTFDTVDSTDESKHYKAFCKKLKRSDYIWNMLDKYPVLLRMMKSIEKNFLHHCTLIIKRFQDDYSQIENMLGKKAGKLRRLTIDAGDTHRNGSSVAVLECENDKIVYKPRSLKADCLYEKVIACFNEQNKQDLKTTKTLDKGDYGWQEFIRFSPCSREEDAGIFYKELGMHLGFVYMFKGTDFHYENIIAQEAKPILLDLETLFQPTLDFRGGAREDQPLQLFDFLSQTVYKSLLLDNISHPEETGSKNLSGLSKMENQAYDEEQVLYPGTDHICIKKVTVEMDRSMNLPICNGRVMEVFGFEKEFMEGFEHVYRFFQAHADMVIAIIRAFPDFPVRIIVRPTYIYASFLQALLHPKYLGRSEERERILSFFDTSYASIRTFQEIVPYEIEDLYGGDIPYFYASFRHRMLYSSKDTLIPCELLQDSPNHEVQYRMRHLSDEDLMYQMELINISLAASRANNGKKQQTESGSNFYKWPIQINSIQNFIETETRDIINKQLKYNDHIQWLSLAVSPGGQMTAGPLSYGLYDGLSGITLYLAAFAHEEGEDFKTIGEDTFRSIKHLLDNSLLSSHFSAYYGVASYVYFTEKLREWKMINEKQAFKIYEDFCGKVIAHYEDISSFDFIGGAAGVLKVLSLLYKKHKIISAKKAADLVFQSLTARASVQEDTMYWADKQAFNNNVLAGFSHGLTGICFALSEYAAVSSIKTKEQVSDVINRALRYEDILFNEERDDWIDNRKDYTAYSHPFWCHGAAGILLGRVLIQQNMGSACQVNHIDDALTTTIQNGADHKQGNSLCHGLLGNLDILLEIRNAPFLKSRKQEIDQTIDAWMSKYVSEMEDSGWNNGVEKDFSGLGLMLGRTGQLYTLLRWKNPDTSLPSVLLLD